MKRKKLITIISVIILTIVFVSCSKNVYNKAINTLKIYVLDEDINIRNAINEYNEKKKSYIEEKEFYSDRRSELTETLQIELHAGSAPDIIIFEPDMLPELSKFIDKGVFYNIDESIKQDKEIDVENYNSTVMGYGVFNGKRYIVPLFYTVKALFSTSEVLAKSGMKANDASFLDIDDICNVASEYVKQDKGKYFFSPLDFSYFMDACGEFINIEGKKASFDTNGFVKLLDSYKKLYETSNKDTTFNEYVKGISSNAPKSGDIVFDLKDMSCFKMLWTNYNQYNDDVIPQIRMIAQGNEHHACAVPVKLAAINANCKDKKAAYGFIKLLLSDKYQENANVHHFPVNNKAYAKQKEIYLKGRGGNDYIIPLRDKGIRSDNSAKKAVSDLEKLLLKMDKCSLSDYRIYDIVSKEVDIFLNGGMSDTEAAKAVQAKVQEYLNAGLSLPQKETASNTTDIKDKGKSNIRLFYMDTSNITNAIRAFEKEYSDIVIKKDIFEGNDIEAYKTKLSTEIMAGEGPDVVVFFNDSYFQSLNKIITSGVFYDLNKSISIDKNFNISDYNDKVLEAGVYSGNRYYIPLSYKFNALFTTSKTLESSNVKYDYKNWTWDNYITLSKSCNKKESGKKYFWGYAQYFDRLYKNCGISFVDYDTKTTSFKSKEFIELLKIYKELYPEITPNEIGSNEKDNMQYFKSCVFASDVVSWYNWEYIWYANNNIKRFLGEEMKVYPMPSLDNGNAKVSIDPLISAAITSSSVNKNGAFNFIKVLLSEDIQGVKDSFGKSNFNCMPVNKKAYEKDMKYYSSEYPDPMSMELVTEIDNLLKNAELGIYYDFNIINIIDEEADLYVHGKKSAEDAAIEIDRKVTLILNE